MSAQPCANHPKEMTYVRCGRCDKPICVRCMVDSPVGKKCRECARNRTHLSEVSPRNTLLAFAAALAAAVPAGAVLAQVSFILILPALIYGYLVAQAALWGGSRNRSVPVQLLTGLAALIGGLVGFGLPRDLSGPLVWSLNLSLMPLLNIAIGVFAAVSRVRFL